MNKPVVLLVAAVTAGLGAFALHAQTVRVSSGPTVQRATPASIAAAARRATRPADLPKPVIAATAQRVMSLPAQPTVADAGVFDVTHLNSGQTTM